MTLADARGEDDDLMMQHGRYRTADAAWRYVCALEVIELELVTSKRSTHEQKCETS
jgi:hypothetical protein